MKYPVLTIRQNLKQKSLINNVWTKANKTISFLHLVRPFVKQACSTWDVYYKGIDRNITRQKFHIVCNISEHEHWCNIGDINKSRDIVMHKTFHNKVTITEWAMNLLFSPFPHPHENLFFILKPRTIRDWHSGYPTAIIGESHSNYRLLYTLWISIKSVHCYYTDNNQGGKYLNWWHLYNKWLL